MPALFTDRDDAGRRLAERLEQQGWHDAAVVLALPRGGLPVAAPVAQRFAAPLDIMLVRKLGFPGHEELAMGAIASGGVRVMNDDILSFGRVSESAIRTVAEREQRELERREREYRGDRPFPELTGRNVILVDDGLATGATMEAAVRATRACGPARVVVAVPVASRDAVRRLSGVADAVTCLEQPEPFGGVGAWYGRFDQTSDDEVRAILARFHPGEGNDG
jgi:putative phosphoribosyl transferase